MNDAEPVNMKSGARGHLAASPAEMPREAWKDISKRTFKRTWDDNVGLIAAGVTFYGFFALLSLLSLVVLSYGFFADPHDVIEHMQVLTSILPRDIASLIGTQLMTSVRSSEEVKGVAIFIAFVVGVYGGTNGAAAILTALNIAYEEKETRSLLHYYLLAMGMTLMALAAALLALASTASLAFLHWLVPEASPVMVFVGKVVGYFLLTLAAAAVASGLYRYGPSREDAKWRWITPGSLFAATSWLVLTAAFGFYLSDLSDYGASYGPLAAAVALLTWLYFSAYALLIGAELNSEIEHQTAKDSTTGPPEPLGERGAWAADNVATTDEIEDRPEEQREGEKLTAAGPEIADSHEKPAN